jgi:GNAT superfamily N-acetyltransferase
VIREASPEDAEGAAALATLVFPEFLRSAESTRHIMRTSPPEMHARWWCAVEDGGVVGWASSTLMVETTEQGVAWLGVTVHPDRRGSGIGGRLLEQAEHHARSVGARKLLGWTRADDGSVAFARSRGYEQTSSHDLLVVDPRAVEALDTPTDVEIRPFKTYADDPRPIYEVDAEATQDEPGEVTLDAVQYDLWLDRYWQHPLLDHDVSMAAVVDGAPASVTFMMTDRASGRGTNNGTGTMRAYRGRGLATTAKRASLARAAELGITAVYTGNDAENAPMQAINRKLGYAPSSTILDWARALVTT